jgi:hypothetical protein
MSPFSRSWYRSLDGLFLGMTHPSSDVYNIYFIYIYG